jgi:hypothetical protein
MTIRTFQAGDELAQVSIYNEAAAGLPNFKPATVDEARRRVQARDFDPSLRLVALAVGRPVGYMTIHLSGRVSYPWCRRGQEAWAAPLFQAGLEALRQRGVRRAWAAYRADWAPVRDFFQVHGFAQTREMLNFIMDLVEMPTPSARAGGGISPVTRADLPALEELGKGLLRCSGAALERHLFDNPYFPPSSMFALRAKPDSPPSAVGIVVHSAVFADPNTLDPNMPCFRLGAFGTEGLTHKRVNGQFSVLAGDTRDFTPLALDLLAQANRRLEDADVASLTAQVPSDAAHLLRFYKSVFRRHGGFPIFERDL